MFLSVLTPWVTSPLADLNSHLLADHCPSMTYPESSFAAARWAHPAPQAPNCRCRLPLSLSTDPPPVLFRVWRWHQLSLHKQKPGRLP